MITFSTALKIQARIVARLDRTVNEFDIALSRLPAARKDYLNACKTAGLLDKALLNLGAQNVHLEWPDMVEDLRLQAIDAQRAMYDAEDVVDTLEAAAGEAADTLTYIAETFVAE